MEFGGTQLYASGIHTAKLYEEIKKTYEIDKSAKVVKLKTLSNIEHKDFPWNDFRGKGYTHFVEKLSEECTETYLRRVLPKMIKNNYNRTYFVDGQSCCRKTSLLGFGGREEETVKVTQFKHLNYRNIDPGQALDYLILSDFVNKKERGEQIQLVDRSPISNLVFQVVYYLMDCFRCFGDQTMTAFETTQQFTPFKMCDDYIQMHNLESVLNFVNKRQYNVLILVDSDYVHVGNRMRNRSRDDADILNSLDDNYHIAQSIAFSYFAYKLNYLCIDLAYLRSFNETQCVFEALSREFRTFSDDIVQPAQMIPDVEANHYASMARMTVGQPIVWEDRYLKVLAISDR